MSNLFLYIIILMLYKSNEVIESLKDIQMVLFLILLFLFGQITTSMHNSRLSTQIYIISSALFLLFT